MSRYALELDVKLWYNTTIISFDNDGHVQIFVKFACYNGET